MLPVAVARQQCRFGGSPVTKFRLHALSTHETSPVKRAASVGFRQRAASALMHPVTLGALGVLLINDLLFKALWPGAWIPGKLSDLAWMMFAPPVLAFLLSFLARRSAAGQRATFLLAYVGLPLLYAAFNTFAPVHDVVLRVLGVLAGTGLVRPWTRRTRSSSLLQWSLPIGYGAGRPWRRRTYALALRFWRR